MPISESCSANTYDLNFSFSEKYYYYFSENFTFEKSSFRIKLFLKNISLEDHGLTLRWTNFLNYNNKTLFWYHISILETYLVLETKMKVIRVYQFRKYIYQNFWVFNIKFNCTSTNGLSFLSVAQKSLDRTSWNFVLFFF